MSKKGMEGILIIFIGIILLVVLFLVIVTKAHSQEIELNMQGKGEIIVIQDGDTLHAIGYGNIKRHDIKPINRYFHYGEDGPLTEKSVVEKKKHSVDYFYAGMPEKAIEKSIEEAKEYEDKGDYYGAFFYYFDGFDLNKAKEMAEKFKAKIGANPKDWQITGLANMYKRFNMKDEYIETVKFLMK